MSCKCGKTHIGESKCPLKTKIQNHQKLALLGEIIKSSLPQYAWEEDNRIRWNDAFIILKEEGWRKRKHKDATFMKILHNAISHSSVDIKNVCPILRSELRRSKMALSDSESDSNSDT